MRALDAHRNKLLKLEELYLEGRKKTLNNINEIYRSLRDLEILNNRVKYYSDKNNYVMYIPTKSHMGFNED